MSQSPQIAKLEVPVEGGTLAAFRFGPPDGVPTVLAIHGIVTNSHVWLAVARSLGGRASLVAVDLRGRGASNQLPPPYGIAEHVADAVATLEELGRVPAVVAGHSLGAYITSILAAQHPDLVQAVVLVDGGLTVRGTESADPQAFLDSFLGPAVARLKLRFPNHEAYRDWWRAHPAFVFGDVQDEDLNAFADHDLAGTEPAMRSRVREEAVRADGAKLIEIGSAADRLRCPATMLIAPLGLLNDPDPMQPSGRARAWAAAMPDARRLIEVPDVNHYTIAMGAGGAGVIADAIAAALAVQPG
jgi:lipase